MQTDGAWRRGRDGGTRPQTERYRASALHRFFLAAAAAAGSSEAMAEDEAAGNTCDQSGASWPPVALAPAGGPEAARRPVGAMRGDDQGDEFRVEWPALDRANWREFAAAGIDPHTGEVVPHRVPVPATASTPATAAAAAAGGSAGGKPRGSLSCASTASPAAAAQPGSHADALRAADGAVRARGAWPRRPSMWVVAGAVLLAYVIAARITA